MLVRTRFKFLSVYPSPMVRELRAPFGGFKQSGVGRDGAKSSVEFFTELKTTMIPIDPPPLPRFGKDRG